MIERLWPSLLLPIMLSLAACSPGAGDAQSATSYPPPAPAAEEVYAPGLQGRAYVETLEIIEEQTAPLQAEARITGKLSDSCTSLEDTHVQRVQTTFHINLVTSYDEQAVCSQALVPFSASIALDLAGLEGGSYRVTAGDLERTFTVDAGSQALPTPDLDAAALSVSVATAQPGETVTLEGRGFPANRTVEIGVGPYASEDEIIAETGSDADGSFTLDVEVPETVETDQRWVYVADVDNAKVYADPINIRESEGAGGEAADRVAIYLIAVDDGGSSGPLVGCNDSVVPVQREIQPTPDPLQAALRELLSISERSYGKNGLYNALFQSELSLEEVEVEEGKAVIYLAGELRIGGTCDAPRIEAQIAQTALQFPGVESVSVFLNEQPLGEHLSLR